MPRQYRHIVFGSGIVMNVELGVPGFHTNGISKCAKGYDHESGIGDLMAILMMRGSACFIIL
jgi:hypothetical protein